MVAILIKRNRYLRHFRIIEAVSADKSILLREHGMRRSLIFDKMVSDGIIKQTVSGRFYLDVAREQEVRKRRRSVILLLLVSVLSALVLALIIIDYFSGDKILMIENW